MESYISFGGWVRRLRRARDLTQAELGDGVGCSHETIRKIEADGRRPSREIAERLAAQFGLQGGDRERFLQAARGGVVASPPATPVAPPLAIAAPPPRAEPRRTNLPAALSSFVGRAREQAAIRHELTRARLLTLSGPGGAGKTRLAVEVARALAPAYPDGAWMVALAPLADPALVPHTAIEALGSAVPPGWPALLALQKLIGERQMLLLLDNCEHLVEACAELTGCLLAACPGLRVLATSREPLRVSGEHVWRVPPLATPDLARLPPLDDLLLYDAVQLFVARAQAVRPDFAPAGEQLLAIAGICAAVDGLPLAIELAAAWARVLSVEQIATRLSARLRLLVGADRGAPARHQTLRATLDWSHDLLGQPERALFRRLAVFAGGFSIEAAEAVVAGAGLAADELLPLLALLADRSLVSVDPPSSGGRYRLLETVREYAAARLAEAGEADAIRERHLRWCLELAQPSPHYGRGELHAALGPWHDNIRAALAFSLGDEGPSPPRPPSPTRGEGAQSRAALGLELAFLVARFWEICGHLGEGRRHLGAALARSPAPSLTRARALWMAGNLAKTQGDIADAEQRYRESLAWFRAQQEPQRVAGLLENLGSLALERGEYEEAHDLYEESLELRRAGGSPGALGSLSYNLGELALRAGDYRRAQAMFAESLGLYRQAGDAWAIADITGAIGWLTYLEGGDLGQASALLDESLAALRAMGTLPSLARRLIQRGDVAWAAGDRAGAARAHRECLELLRELQHPTKLADLLDSLARAALADGRATAAARLLGAAAGLRQASATPLPPQLELQQSRLAAAIAAQIGQAGLAALIAAGATLSLDQAFTAAEQEIGPA